MCRFAHAFFVSFVGAVSDLGTKFGVQMTFFVAPTLLPCWPSCLCDDVWRWCVFASLYGATSLFFDWLCVLHCGHSATNLCLACYVARVSAFVLFAWTVDLLACGMEGSGKCFRCTTPRSQEAAPGQPGPSGDPKRGKQSSLTQANLLLPSPRSIRPSVLRADPQHTVYLNLLLSRPLRRRTLLLTCPIGKRLPRCLRQWPAWAFKTHCLKGSIPPAPVGKATTIPPEKRLAQWGSRINILEKVT